MARVLLLKEVCPVLMDHTLAHGGLRARVKSDTVIGKIRGDEIDVLRKDSVIPISCCIRETGIRGATTDTKCENCNGPQKCNRRMGSHVLELRRCEQVERRPYTTCCQRVPEHGGSVTSRLAGCNQLVFAHGSMMSVMGILRHSSSADRACVCNTLGFGLG